MGGDCEGVKVATADIRLFPCSSVAPIWRDTAQMVERAAWGARLRTRKVTGRDASLPAPCLSFLFELVVRETVGALPQTPQGTLFLDPARGRRKGTKSPLDPFSRLSWSHFHASSACSFLVLRLSPCLLPPTFREEPFYCTKKEKPLMQLPLMLLTSAWILPRNRTA